MPKSKFGRENPNVIDTPEDESFVHFNEVEEVQRRGFWGTPATDEDKSKYTVEGVTQGESRLTGPGVETHGLDVQTEQPHEERTDVPQTSARRARHENKEGSA